MADIIRHSQHAAVRPGLTLTGQLSGDLLILNAATNAAMIRRWTRLSRPVGRHNALISIHYFLVAGAGFEPAAFRL